MSVSLFHLSCRLRLAALLKKKLWHRCFPVNFVKFLRKMQLERLSQNVVARLQLEVYQKQYENEITLKVLLISISN